MGEIINIKQLFDLPSRVFKIEFSDVTICCCFSTIAKKIYVAIIDIMLKNFVEVICNTEKISNFVLGDYSD